MPAPIDPDFADVAPSKLILMVPRGGGTQLRISVALSRAWHSEFFQSKNSFHDLTELDMSPAGSSPFPSHKYLVLFSHIFQQRANPSRLLSFPFS
ncbi:UNVERIFIED_CONTAM: hypothetical protein Sradi_6122200 [Sesamum radiatum]|uniref:Sulfotransferase n=1 Tax=Sesamum radiatum TaxID=300843 RepID=A0AAW2KJQ0_SESRA